MKKPDPQIAELERAVTELGHAEDLLTAKMKPASVDPVPVPKNASAVTKLTARIRNITNHMNAAA